jgi:2'-5' RNA ligase
MSTLERVFLAIDCDAETRAAQVAQLNDAFALGSLPGRPTPPANWHITLRWLGNVDEVTLDCLMAELDQGDLGSCFRLKLTGLGAFPNPMRAGVLWRAVDDTEGRVGALAEQVEQVCRIQGLPAEERPYVPHLTLSLLRPRLNVDHLVATELHPLTMPVTAITVFRSVPGQRHSGYEVLELIELTPDTSPRGSG